MASEYGRMNFLDEVTVRDAWSERIWVHMSGTKGWQWGQAPIVYIKNFFFSFFFARVSNSLWQLSPARSLLVWLRYKPSGTATTDRRRGEGGLPGAWKSVLAQMGLSQSGKTVHLREGLNSDFKPPLPCGHTHSWERLRDVNPEEKSGAGVPLRQSRLYTAMLWQLLWRHWNHVYQRLPFQWTIPVMWRGGGSLLYG